MFKKRKVKEACHTYEFDTMNDMISWLKKNIKYYENAMELSFEAAKNKELTGTYIINIQRIKLDKVREEFLKSYGDFEFLEKYRIK